MNGNWQKRAANFAERHNLQYTPGVYALDLMSELGEVAKEVLLATAYGKRPFVPHSDKLMGELGDALYSLCQLATAVGVDLDAALATTLAKYEARWQEQGHPGSAQNNAR